MNSCAGFTGDARREDEPIRAGSATVDVGREGWLHGNVSGLRGLSWSGIRRLSCVQRGLRVAVERGYRVAIGGRWIVFGRGERIVVVGRGERIVVVRRGERIVLKWAGRLVGVVGR